MKTKSKKLWIAAVALLACISLFVLAACSGGGTYAKANKNWKEKDSKAATDVILINGLTVKTNSMGVVVASLEAKATIERSYVGNKASFKVTVEDIYLGGLVASFVGDMLPDGVYIGDLKLIAFVTYDNDTGIAEVIFHLFGANGTEDGKFISSNPDNQKETINVKEMLQDPEMTINGSTAPALKLLQFLQDNYDLAGIFEMDNVENGKLNMWEDGRVKDILDLANVALTELRKDKNGFMGLDLTFKEIEDTLTGTQYADIIELVKKNTQFEPKVTVDLKNKSFDKIVVDGTLGIVVRKELMANVMALLEKLGININDLGLPGFVNDMIAEGFVIAAPIKITTNFNYDNVSLIDLSKITVPEVAA